MKGDPVLLYMTAGSDAEARSIAETLVSERLVACANILGPVTSIYQWQGRVENGAEVSVVMKSRQDLVARIADRVRELHSYDCPCLVATPITGGHAPFVAWIGDETA
ncbi:MAG: divalent-cation tolerance protein CutA [Rhodospirillaceae bacterium]